MAQFLGQIQPQQDKIADSLNLLAQQIQQRKSANMKQAQDLITSGQYAPNGPSGKPGIMDRLGYAMNGPTPGGSNMNIGGQNFQYVSPQQKAESEAQLNAQKIKATMGALGPTLGSAQGGMSTSGMSIDPMTGKVNMSYKQPSPTEAAQLQHTNLENQILQNKLAQDPTYQNKILEQRQANLDRTKMQIELDKKRLSQMGQSNPQDVRFKQQGIELREKQIQSEQLRINQMKQQIDSQNGTSGLDLNKTPQQLQSDISKKDPSYAKYLKSLAEGRMTLNGRSSKTQMQVQKDLATIYPDLDMSKIQARYATRKDFTVGTAAKNIKSLNTAVGHLNEMNKVIPELKNSNWRTYNSVKNWFSREMDNPTVVKFNAIKTALSGELSTIYKNSGGTDQEIKSVSESIDSSDSPEQLKTAIDEVISLMGGRLNALQDQWHNAYDRQDDADFPVISSRSKETLNEITGDGSPNKEVNASYKDENEVEGALKSGKVKIGDTVTVNGQQFKVEE